MRRFLRHHALEALLAAAMAAAGTAAYYGVIFVDSFGVVQPGRLYRCRQPRGGQWRMLRQRGIAAVVNLRTEAESPDALARERRACAAAGAAMVHVPVAEVLPRAEQVEAFLKAARGSPGAVLVHCKHGEDRTGTMVAAYRVVVDGWPVRKAVAEMVRYRARLSGAKRAGVIALLRRLRGDRTDWLERTGPRGREADVQ